MLQTFGIMVCGVIVLMLVMFGSVVICTTILAIWAPILLSIYISYLAARCKERIKKWKRC